jgi:hypothetical protein
MASETSILIYTAFIRRRCNRCNNDDDNNLNNFFKDLSNYVFIMSSPFTQGTDFISDTEECRRLARNIVQGDFTDEQIEPWQVSNYSVICSLTGISNWSTSDIQFYALKGIETRLTAADLHMHYGDGSTESIATAQQMKDAAMAELTALITASGLGTGATSAVGANMIVGQTPYKSWNLNGDVQIPRRGLHVY